jgi:crotonobetainyl-CoA:carnitine CoA-transferase CaiB-like acyl-CoA transferase
MRIVAPGTFAVMVTLNHRRRTGEGQLIELVRRPRRAR